MYTTHPTRSARRITTLLLPVIAAGVLLAGCNKLPGAVSSSPTSSVAGATKAPAAPVTPAMNVSVVVTTASASIGGATGQLQMTRLPGRAELVEAFT